MSSLATSRPAETPSPEIASHARALARPWRIAFLVYLLAMTTGTHWPRLRFGAEIPATDKTIHMFAFAGLTFLLWRARWVRMWPAAAMLVLAWAIVDEFTQGIPGLGRTVSPDDITADVLGVAVAAAFLWSIRRVGGGRERRAYALRAYGFDHAFSRGRAWGLLSGIVAAGIAAIAVAWPLTEPAVTAAFIRGTAVVVSVAGIVATLVLWRRGVRAVADTRRCFACGAPNADRARGDAAGGRCQRCGSPLDAGQWTLPERAPLRWRSFAAPLARLAGAIAVAALAFGVAAQAVAMLLDADPAPTATARIARLVEAIPPRLARTLVIGGLLVAGFLFTGWHRAAAARREGDEGAEGSRSRIDT